MQIKNQEINEGDSIKIIDYNEGEYIGFVYEPSFFKQIMGYKIGLTIKKRKNIIDNIRHEIFPFKEKHIKEIEPRLNPLGLKRLYGGLGVRKAKLKELETL